VIGEELQGTPEPSPMERRLYADSLSLDAIVADAAQRLPGYRANYISLPWAAGGDVTLYGSFSDAGPLRSPYGTHVAYDSQTGIHKSTFDLRTAGAWAQAVDAFTPLHFGNFGGLPIKLLWCLGGLTPGVLAVSGFIIWQQRRRKRPPTSRVSSDEDREGVAPPVQIAHGPRENSVRHPSPR
jgi:uncharacterized iron-regulated membrane protein